MRKQSKIISRESSVIRVLIVEDSPTDRRYLKHIIDSHEGLEVVGTAEDGEAGLRLARLKRPDIVTMDIHMPGMDGYVATRRIMEECPVPVVVVTSSWHPEQITNSFRAMEAGALTVLEKPPGPGHPRSKPSSEKLVQTLKTMSQVKVVRRIPSRKVPRDSPVTPSDQEPFTVDKRVDVVAMGASTGGPPVIRKILSGLGQGLSVPIIIVQHIAPGFLKGMVDWLNREVGPLVKIAADGESIRAGDVYFAPDGCHLGVSGGGRIALTEAPPENGVRPSVSYLFRSVARAYGDRGAGILLTGMGRDGALELSNMREKGALAIAQDKESCVVYGMPAEAVKLNEKIHVLSPERIAGVLNSIGGG